MAIPWGNALSCCCHQYQPPTPATIMMPSTISNGLSHLLFAAFFGATEKCGRTSGFDFP
jgi:hypothetical protein